MKSLSAALALLLVVSGRTVGAFAPEEESKQGHTPTRGQGVTSTYSAASSGKSLQRTDERRQGAISYGNSHQLVRLRLCHFSDFHSSYELSPSLGPRLPKDLSCCSSEHGKGHLSRLAIMQYILNSLCPTNTLPHNLVDGKKQDNGKGKRDSSEQTSSGGLTAVTRATAGPLLDRKVLEDQYSKDETKKGAGSYRTTAEPTHTHEDWTSHEKQEWSTSHSLRLFGGDMSPGKAEYDAFGGALGGSTLKELEVHLAALGNHDIASSWSHLDELMAANGGATRFLGANLSFDNQPSNQVSVPHAEENIQRGPDGQLLSPSSLQDAFTKAARQQQTSVRDTVPDSLRPSPENVVRFRSRYLVDYVLWFAEASGRSRLLSADALESQGFSESIENLSLSRPVAAACFVGAVTEELPTLACPPPGVRLRVPVSTHVRLALRRCRQAFRGLARWFDDKVYEVAHGKVDTHSQDEGDQPSGQQKRSGRAVPPRERPSSQRFGENAGCGGGNEVSYDTKQSTDSKTRDAEINFGSGTQQPPSQVRHKSGQEEAVGILISHLGYREERRLAAILQREVSFVFSGHSHTVLPPLEFPGYVLGRRRGSSSYVISLRRMSMGPKKPGSLRQMQHGRATSDRGAFVVPSGSHGKRVAVVDLMFDSFYTPDGRSHMEMLPPSFSYVDVDEFAEAFFAPGAQRNRSELLQPDKRNPSTAFRSTRDDGLPRKRDECTDEAASPGDSPRTGASQEPSCNARGFYKCRRTAHPLPPFWTSGSQSGRRSPEEHTSSPSTSPVPVPSASAFVACFPENISSRYFFLPWFGFAGANAPQPPAADKGGPPMFFHETLFPARSLAAAHAIKLPRNPIVACGLPVVKTVVCPYTAQIVLTRRQGQLPLAHVASDGINGSFDHCRRSECAMGRLIADALRSVSRTGLRLCKPLTTGSAGPVGSPFQGKHPAENGEERGSQTRRDMSEDVDKPWVAVIAFQSSGNIRGSFEGGHDVTELDVLQAFPWDNKLEIVHLTVEDLLSLWRRSLVAFLSSGKCILPTPEAPRMFPHLAEAMRRSGTAADYFSLNAAAPALPPCSPEEKDFALESPSLIQMSGAHIQVVYDSNTGVDRRDWLSKGQTTVFISVLPTLTAPGSRYEREILNTLHPPQSSEEIVPLDGSFWIGVTRSLAEPGMTDGKGDTKVVRVPVYASKKAVTQTGPLLVNQIGAAFGLSASQVVVETNIGAGGNLPDFLLPIFVKKPGKSGSAAPIHREQLTVPLEHTIIIGVLTDFLIRGGDGLVVDDYAHKFSLKPVEVLPDDVATTATPRHEDKYLANRTTAVVSQSKSRSESDRMQGTCLSRIGVVNSISRLTLRQVLIQFLQERSEQPLRGSSEQRMQIHFGVTT